MCVDKMESLDFIHIMVGGCTDVRCGYSLRIACQLPSNLSVCFGLGGGAGFSHLAGVVGLGFGGGKGGFLP